MDLSGVIVLGGVCTLNAVAILDLEGVVEFVLPDKYTGGETRHIITDVFETKVLLVKQFDIEVWE